jgi:STE24 endopeptidase
LVEASRRSAHSNAAFVGIGNARRVVLSDTLIEALDQDEVEAVVAHELGHRGCGHVRTYFVVICLLRLAALAIFARLAGDERFLPALGISASGPHVTLITLGLVIAAATPFVAPFKAALIRRFEHQADAFAARFVAGETLVTALEKLHGKNLAAPRPEPVYATLLLAHPPLAERARRLRMLTANTPGRGSQPQRGRRA